MTKKRIFIILKSQSVHLNEGDLAKRILQTYRCESVLIAKSISNNEISFFIGFVCEATKNQVILIKTIETLFREFHFEKIQFRKGFAPICCDFVRRGAFLQFGNLSREEVFQIAENARQHRKLLSSSSIPKRESRNDNNRRGKVNLESFFLSISRRDLVTIKRYLFGGIGLGSGFFIFNWILSSAASLFLIFLEFLENRIYNTEFQSFINSFLEHFDANLLDIEVDKPLENDDSPPSSTPKPKPGPNPVYVTLGILVAIGIIILIYKNAS